jgi:CheY-like chemotaxis protein
MPGRNGLQLQSRLAAAAGVVPIIFITAYDDNEFRRRAIQAGATAGVRYLSKSHSFRSAHIEKPITLNIDMPASTCKPVRVSSFDRAGCAESAAATSVFRRDALVSKIASENGISL